MLIRPIRRDDLSAIDAIQLESPQAAHWPAIAYLDTVCMVAVEETIVGFAAGRQLVADEAEILNIAVARQWRRRGVGGMLMKALLERLSGEIFLEVRTSNVEAIRLYESLGFARAGTRKLYYAEPDEDAIVLRFQPC